ncbi:aldehyde dehydrogenase (NADP(+)) [Acinetobacter sp. MD2(2019)]|uniref:aldehyde dehydrogenase (NADP(+)) n=1 Tax=Acinetobacter sp. MD2(2019) TaxID=2605273 RepID=UPI002D1F5DAF|nr:aldehyde dehydrogenase (NADP(+)) [Acinetobacter sp. MD2(2019)]MEB3754149.1 aldehyde dehydrogenase (NADP(+)) [Acinetobacter sp. MD2(2019)]
MSQNNGQQFINGSRVATHAPALESINATDYQPTGYLFSQATLEEVNQAAEAAHQAFLTYQNTTQQQRAEFLEEIAVQIEALGPKLQEVASLETGLPLPRLQGETGRVTGQLRLFAQLLRRGDFYGARIDTALPERKPLPRVDLRQYKVGVGPVAVFGASNFPLAFSTAGGDTVAALAAGCPVVFKAHSGHMATAELVAEAIEQAIVVCGMPSGTFNMIFGSRVGADLVKHPLIQAAGFTGSLDGGMALFSLAQNRPQPIPFFAEMSSVNPVVVLPNALKARGEKIAQDTVASFNMGCGQFCTKPGLILGVKSPEFDQFVATLVESTTQAAPQVMLNQGTLKSYQQGLAALEAEAGFEVIAQGQAASLVSQAQPHLIQADQSVLLSGNPKLQHEIFGPVSIVIAVDDQATLLQGIEALAGQLTATIIMDDADANEAAPLLQLFTRKAGRVLFNGFPTGVEVSDAMVHGGPFPATSDARGTSVGTGAIERFLRPVCYQNTPQALLPEALKDGNPLKINRLVNGSVSQD